MCIREQVAPIIAGVVTQIGRSDPKALRTALKAAYPFVERTGWPYKVWLSEIKAQIGGVRVKKPDPNQLTLF